MLLFLAALMFGAAILYLARGLGATPRGRTPALRRISAYSGPGAGARLDVRLDRLSDRHGPRLARIATRLDPRATEERIGVKLVAGGLAGRMSPVSFLATKVVTSAGFALGGMFLGAVAGSFGQGILLAVIGLVIGFIAPDLILMTRARGRREQIRRDLPDALDVLAVGVSAGHGFDAAVSKLSEHMDGPLVEQFQLVLAEMEMGEYRPTALRRMADRLDIPEVTAVVSAIVQSEQVGAPLSKVLRTQATESRLRRRVAAEETAMKAPVKMVLPTGVFIFPSVMIVILAPALIEIFKTV